MIYKNLSDNELENTLRTKAAAERQLTLEIVALLEEIDRRKLYLQKGYGSLIEYCVKEFKYSESSAYRRISAMRLIREVPETKAAIEDGSLNLVTVAKAQTFFKAEAKANKRHSPESKKALLNQLKNQSTREAEKMLLELSPDSAPKEKIRQVTGNKTQVPLIIADELMQKLDRLKNLLSHKISDDGYVNLIDQLADLALKKLDPASTTSRLRNAKPALGSTSSRYIPPAVRRQVWLKSQSQCCYQSPGTELRCTAKRFLEVDHIMPFSAGGETTPKNLQLLCDAHNRLKGTTLAKPVLNEL